MMFKLFQRIFSSTRKHIYIYEFIAFVCSVYAFKSICGNSLLSPSDFGIHSWVCVNTKKITTLISCHNLYFGFSLHQSSKFCQYLDWVSICFFSCIRFWLTLFWLLVIFTCTMVTILIHETLNFALFRLYIVSN